MENRNSLQLSQMKAITIDTVVLLAASNRLWLQRCLQQGRKIILCDM